MLKTLAWYGVALAIAGCSSTASKNNLPASGGQAGAGGQAGSGGQAAASGAGGSGATGGSAGSAGAGGAGGSGGIQCSANPNEPTTPTSVAVGTAFAHIASGPCGEYALTWIDKTNKHVFFATTWTLSKPLDLGESNGSPPRVAYTSGHSWAQRRYLVTWITGSSATEGEFTARIVQPEAGTHISTDGGFTGGTYRHPNAVGIGSGTWLLATARRDASDQKQVFRQVSSDGVKKGSSVDIWPALAVGPGSFSSHLDEYVFAASGSSELTIAAAKMPTSDKLDMPKVSAVWSQSSLRTVDTRAHALQLSPSVRLLAFDSVKGVSVATPTGCTEFDQLDASSSVLGLAECGTKGPVALVNGNGATQLHRVNACSIETANVLTFDGLGVAGIQEATVASTPQNLAVAWTNSAGELKVRVDASVCSK